MPCAINPAHYDYATVPDIALLTLCASLGTYGFGRVPARAKPMMLVPSSTAVTLYSPGLVTTPLVPHSNRGSYRLLACSLNWQSALLSLTLRVVPYTLRALIGLFGSCYPSGCHHAYNPQSWGATQAEWRPNHSAVAL